MGEGWRLGCIVVGACEASCGFGCVHLVSGVVELLLAVVEVVDVALCAGTRAGADESVQTLMSRIGAG